MATKTQAKPKITIGGLIDAMSAIRDARRKIAAEDKALSEEAEGLKEQLITLMDAEGMAKATGRNASAGITETLAFNFDGELGFETFMPWMAKNKFWHLIQRRTSAPAMREIFEKKGAIPGVVPFTKRDISLRDL